MKWNGKKMTAALVMIASGLFLTACGRSKASGSMDTDIKNTTYAMQDMDVSAVEGDSSFIFNQDGKVYMVTELSEDITDYPPDWVDGMPPEGQEYEDIEYKYERISRVYTMAEDGSQITELVSIHYDPDTEETKSIQGVAPLTDDELVVLFSSYDYEKDEQSYTLAVFTGGEKKSEVPLDALAQKEPYLNTILTDAQGRIFIKGDNMIFCVNAEGAEQFSVKSDTYLQDAVRSSKGDILVLSTAEDGEGSLIRKVNPDKKGFDGGFTPTRYVSRLYNGSGDYDYYFSDDNGIYGGKSDGSCKMLMNFIASNMRSNTMNSLEVSSDLNIIGRYYDYFDAEADTRLVYLKKLSPSEVEDRQVLVLGGMYIDDSLISQALKFNRSQNKYQILIREYSSENNASEKMNADILAGDVPDIICLSYLPYEKYINKGMLADLYTFMDKDPDINKEDFTESIMKACERDGKLYFTAPYYSLNVLVTNKDYLKDASGMTMDEMMELEKKSGVRAFSSNTTSSSILQDLCRNSYGSLIDYNTGKCSFDSEGFVKLLEYAATYPQEIPEDGEWSNATLLKNKEILFNDIWNLDFSDVEFYDKALDHKAAFIGYPSQDRGLAANMNSKMGIYSKSKNADGAWEFFKSVLTREYMTGNAYNNTGFPIRKDAFEDKIKEAMATEDYVDEFGGQHMHLDTTYTVGDVEIEIKPVTEEQAQIVTDLVGHIDRLYSENEEINAIVEEEAGALFSGQKSAKDVAGIIQNRVTTFVNENR